jgi:hypothetical protein
LVNFDHPEKQEDPIRMIEAGKVNPVNEEKR